MTVYHPESVAGTSVNISQNAKEGLGDFRHIEAVFDIDLTPAAGETILYEIQGSVKKQNVDTKRVPQGPRFSVNIFEK